MGHFCRVCHIHNSVWLGVSLGAARCCGNGRTTSTVSFGGSVEETLNALLDAEADRLCNARRYERSEARRDTRASHAALLDMARKVGVVRDDARFPFTARRPRPPRDNDANWSRLHTRETASLYRWLQPRLRECAKAPHGLERS